MNIGGSYRFTAIILGFSVNYAAYFAEIYRSGIESMPRDSMRRRKCWGTAGPKHFLRLFFPR